MKIGTNTRKFLRLLDGPPSPDDMKDLMFALSWDGDVEHLANVSAVMVDHHLHQRPADQDEHRKNSAAFNWWLGVRGVATSMANAREFRRSMRGGK